jgi:hypothetical protein
MGNPGKQHSEGAGMTMGLEIVISHRAAAVITAAAGRPGPAAHTARAWIDSLTTRAQLRSERRVRQHAGRTAEREVIV